jgi:uncharacterized cupin superfamily protein
MPVDEAQFDELPNGRNPASEGWFVLNLADAAAFRNEEKGGAVIPLEPRGGPFTDFGVNVHVVWPGEPSALYHSESVREAFLVLSGECTLIVEEEERPLRQWDFFHCPAGTRHIFVGAGEGPCAILMIGGRPEERRTLHYPVSDVAARHGASVATETPNPDQAYADWPGEFVPVRLPWPPDEQP